MVGEKTSSGNTRTKDILKWVQRLHSVRYSDTISASRYSLKDKLDWIHDIDYLAAFK